MGRGSCLAFLATHYNQIMTFHFRCIFVSADSLRSNHSPTSYLLIINCSIVLQF